MLDIEAVGQSDSGRLRLGQCEGKRNRYHHRIHEGSSLSNVASQAFSSLRSSITPDRWTTRARAEERADALQEWRWIRGKQKKLILTYDMPAVKDLTVSLDRKKIKTWR